MKKLRMIIASAIVLAIVGSAFSLKAKTWSYCVLTNTASGTNCTTFIQGKKRALVGLTTYKYYKCWEGDVVQCTTVNNGLCTDGPATFVLD